MNVSREMRQSVQLALDRYRRSAPPASDVEAGSGKRMARRLVAHAQEFLSELSVIEEELAVEEQRTTTPRYRDARGGIPVAGGGIPSPPLPGAVFPSHGGRS